MTHEEKRARRLARTERMAELYRSGFTLAQIGEEFRLSKQRIDKLLEEIGVAANEGGQHVRALKKRAAFAAKYAAMLDANTLKRWGITRAEWIALKEQYGSSEHNVKHPLCAFWSQRQGARNRGIPWEITFPQWWALWQASGKWAQRGRGYGYCMARVGDRGAYRPDNVYICTAAKNASDSYIFRPAHTRKRRAQQQAA